MPTKQKVTKGLHQTLALHPEIALVHFTGDGQYHLNAHNLSGKYYTRLVEGPETTAKGLSTGKSVLSPIMDDKNKPHIKYAVVESVKREDVLATTPIAENEETLLQVDALDILGISEDEYSEFMKTRKK